MLTCLAALAGVVGLAGCSSPTTISPATSTVGSRTLIVERAREVPPPNNTERGGVLAVPVYAEGWPE